MIKTVSPFLLTSLLLFPLTLHQTEARLSFTTLRQITEPNEKKIFKPGYEHLNVIHGFLGTISGLIYNLRFYGDSHWEIDLKTGERIYAEDKGNDNLHKIIKILFPSIGGGITTQTNRTSALSIDPDDPKLLSLVISYSQALSKKEDKDAEQYKKKIVEYKETGQTARKDLLKLIGQYYKEGESANYPPHFLQTVFLAFFWEHYNTKKHIVMLYENLNDGYVDKEAVKAINPDDTLTIENFIQQKGSLEEIALQNIYGRRHYGSMTCYLKGESLISNGDANPYDRSTSQTLKNLKFQDCVEVSIRHLLNLLLFDRDQSFSNRLVKVIKTIEAKYQEWKPNQALVDLITFYEKEQPNQDCVNDGAANLRTAFAKVVGDLNSLKLDPQFLSPYEEDPDFGRVYYVMDIGQRKAYELKSGCLNTLHAIEHVFGIRLEKLAGQKEAAEIENARLTMIKLKGQVNSEYIEAYKTYIEGKLKVLLVLIPTEFSYGIDEIKVEGTPSNLANPYDLFNTSIKITGKKKEGQFTFELFYKNNHATTNLLDEKSSLSEKFTDFKFPKELEYSLFEALKPSRKRKFTYLFYQTFGKGPLDNNDARLRLLEDFSRRPKIDKRFQPTLFMLLRNYGWDDPHTASEGLEVINALALREDLPQKVFSGIQAFDFYDPVDKVFLQTTLPKCENLKKLKVNNSSSQKLALPLGLKELSLDYINFGEEKVDFSHLLELESIELIGVTAHSIEIPHTLKRFRIQDCSLESEVDLLKIQNVEHLKLSNWKSVLPDFQNLKSLQLSDIESQELLDLSKFSKLESLTLKRITGPKIVLENLSKLNNLEIEDCHFDSVIDLSSLENLKKIEIFSVETKNIKLPKSKEINEVNFDDLTLHELNVVLDLSTLENLQKVKLVNIKGENLLLKLGNFETLGELTIEECDLGGEILDLSSMKALRTLSLGSVKAKDVILPNDQLESLTLSRQEYSKDYTLDLSPFTKLQTLFLKDIKAKQTVLPKPQYLQKLTLCKMNLSNITDFRTSLSLMTDLKDIVLQDIEAENIVLRDLSNLKEITLRRCACAKLVELSDLDQLEKIVFNEVHTPEIKLSKLDNLNTLKIDESEVKNPLMIRSLPRLENIAISSIKVPEVIFEDLNLVKKLNLSGISQSDLNFSKCRVENLSLENIDKVTLKLPNPQYLLSLKINRYKNKENLNLLDFNNLSEISLKNIDAPLLLPKAPEKEIKMTISRKSYDEVKDKIDESKYKVEIIEPPKKK